MFSCVAGTFNNLKNRNNIDELHKWSLDYFKNTLELRPSIHVYIDKLPENIKKKIYKLTNSDEILNKIKDQFPNYEITNVKRIDEIYLSHYNIDLGGDQGLFTKHYDGNLRGFKKPTFVRALIYLSSDGSYEVEFIDCKKRVRFKKYDFGLLDFNREFHTVHGNFKENQEPRILLKMNYYVCAKCSLLEKQIYYLINYIVFKTVKFFMEYSKSPDTILKKIVGINCNLVRVINNYSSIFIIPLLILYLYIAYMLHNKIEINEKNILYLVLLMILINTKFF